MKNIGPIPQDQLIQEVLSGNMATEFVNAILDFTKNTNILDAKLLDGVVMLTIERAIRGSIICRNKINNVRFTFTCHESNNNDDDGKTRFRILNANAVVTNDENLGDQPFKVEINPLGAGTFLSFATDWQDPNNPTTYASVYRLGVIRTYPIWGYLDDIIEHAIDQQIKKDPGNYAIRSFGKPRLD